MYGSLTFNSFKHSGHQLFEINLPEVQNFFKQIHSAASNVFTGADNDKMQAASEFHAFKMNVNDIITHCCVMHCKKPWISSYEYAH